MIFMKSSGLNDSVYGKSQDPIKLFLTKDDEQAKKNSQIENIFNVVPLTTYAGKYGYLTTKGDMEPVGEGGAYPELSQQEGYSNTIEPDTFKAKFPVTEEMIEDATMFDVKQSAADFVPSYYRSREKFGSTLLNTGNATTMTFKNKVYPINTADNAALFSTAHTSKTGGTANQSNYFNMGFSYDNLSRAEEAMQKFTDDDGNLLDIQPDTIIIPNNARIKKLVSDAVWSKPDQAANSADNGYNYQAGRWHVITWNYLTNFSGITAGYDMFMLMDSKRNKIDGLIWCDRLDLSVRSWIDDNTGNNIWGGRARFGAKPINWRSIACGAAGLGTTLA